MDLLNDNTIQRFWSKISVKSNGCWEYDGGYVWESGYPCFWFEGKSWRANRFILSVFLGKPSGLKNKACHHCDNKACVNPAHLYWGSDRDNRKDYIERNPSGAGVRSQFSKGHAPFYGASKLSEVEVAYIKMFLSIEDKPGVTRRHLAECYGVKICTIKSIAGGRSWKNVKPFPFKPINA